LLLKDQQQSARFAGVSALVCDRFAISDVVNRLTGNTTSNQEEVQFVVMTDRLRKGFTLGSLREITLVRANRSALRYCLIVPPPRVCVCRWSMTRRSRHGES
jgi:hypothetical protein